MPTIVFLFPSYQPTALSCELLEELRKVDPSPIVVVDDGSGPAYSELFQRAARLPGTVVLTNAVNLGKGAALKHGMNDVLVRHPDCIGVVTADADGQHAVSDILKVANELRARPAEAVVGARDFKREVPFRSKIGNVISRYVYRFLIGLKLSDTQTGLRGIPRRLAELSLSIRANRFEFETEQLIVLNNERIAVREIPIQTVYIDDNRGSHFNPVLDSFRIYFVLLRYGLSSIATALTDFVVFYILTANGMSVLNANMSARAFALWLQFMLLKKYVFKTGAGVSIFAAYVAYVFFSGYVSSVMQGEIRRLRDGSNAVGQGGGGIGDLDFQFHVPAGHHFPQLERSLKPEQTDWNSYYAKPYRTASLTRQHTASVLVELMRRNGGAQASILEFGGANSCFIDQILEEVRPSRYDVIDSNQLGLDLLRSRYSGDDRVSASLGDVLSTSTPARLYDIVFSVGLIEHFDPSGTAKAVAAHFSHLRPGGTAIITFPTSTWPYLAVLGLTELTNNWTFHDERRFGCRNSNGRLPVSAKSDRRAFCGADPHAYCVVRNLTDPTGAMPAAHNSDFGQLASPASVVKAMTFRISGWLGWETDSNAALGLAEPILHPSVHRLIELKELHPIQKRLELRNRRIKLVAQNRAASASSCSMFRLISTPGSLLNWSPANR